MPTSASAANTALNRLVSGETLRRAASSPRQRMAMRPRRAVGSNMGKDSALISLKGAELAAMAPEHIFDIERRGVEALGDLRNFGRCDEEHNGRRIDKAADQPWASNAVDLRLLARHPDGAAASVAFRNLVGVNGRELRLLPGDLVAFEN